MTTITDTAYLVAFYRALESDRPDALFRDPFARRFAGTRGERLAQQLGSVDLASAIVTLRTAVFDELILDAVVHAGVEIVLNLGAGLDARAYRLQVPRSVRWFNVDLPEIVGHRRVLLAGAEPRCKVEEFSLDLADHSARAQLFERLDADDGRILVVTEGLLMYLAPSDVGKLAVDLLARSSIVLWVTDLISPMAARQMNAAVNRVAMCADTTLRFAPARGARFFQPFGWSPATVRPLLSEARRLGRSIALPRFLSLLIRVTEPWPACGVLPMDGTVLLARQSPSRTA